VSELSLFGVALIGGFAVGRLTTSGGAWRDVVAAAVVGEALTAVASRRLSGAWSSVVGTAGVALAAVWLSAPAGALWHGLPNLTTLRILGRQLRAVGPVHLPVAGGAGVVLIGMVVAGVAGVGTRALPGALGLVPGVALLAGSTVALGSPGAELLAVALAGAGVVLLVARSAERVGALLATATTLASVAGVVVVGAAGGTGSASGGGIPVAGVPPTALSLVSHLTALQIRDPDLVLFTARSPLPTYWQVGSLSVLSGNTWVPDAATAAALAGRGGSPPSVPAAGGPSFTATVTVANLSSRLLPVPPDTRAVSGATLSAVGALASTASAPGLTFTATATVPETDIGVGAASAGPSGSDTVDTRLPSLPPGIVTLAQSITASAATPLEKAESLTNWFRSRLFHYSLKPTGVSLISFLTSSHTGSCEQFAGAYAVLGRAVGLPTRVAIGFTTGVRDPAGQTVVRGIDAHAWPQVLLGGNWISFEPTPERPSGELSPPGVIGLSAVGTPNPVGPTSIPRSPPGLSFPVPGRSTTVSAVPRASVLWWWLTPLLAVGAVLPGAELLRRRRRRNRTAGDELRSAWGRIDRVLGRRQMARPAWRTPVAHSRLLRSQMGGDEMDAVWAELEWLAVSLEEEVYGSRPAGVDDGRRARVAGRQVTRSLSVGPGRRTLVRGGRARWP